MCPPHKCHKEKLYLQLLTNPAILFCDEPTTGLDSYSAQKIVHMMGALAAQNKTVLCTIHQPSSEVFNLFHEIILLVDGRIAFMGTTENAVAFFARLINVYIAIYSTFA
jgi:ABC-type multidrug transport system ATPase subunit